MLGHVQRPHRIFYSVVAHVALRASECARLAVIRRRATHFRAEVAGAAAWRRRAEHGRAQAQAVPGRWCASRVRTGAASDVGPFAQTVLVVLPVSTDAGPRVKCSKRTRAYWASAPHAPVSGLQPHARLYVKTRPGHHTPPAITACTVSCMTGAGPLALPAAAQPRRRAGVRARRQVSIGERWRALPSAAGS